MVDSKPDKLQLAKETEVNIKSEDRKNLGVVIGTLRAYKRRMQKKKVMNV